MTETAAMSQPETAAVVMRRLSHMGVGLTVDDFGTGFSSLGYLRDLPVSIIKVDKLFVLGMDSDERDEMIVRSTVLLAHALGKTVVAEGVESEASRHLLSEMGCDYGQGYLWSRPVPADQFVRWLAEQPEVEVQGTGDRRGSWWRGGVRLPAVEVAVRRLARAHDDAEVAEILRDVVADLGGTIVDYAAADDSAIPLDLTASIDRPHFATAAPGSLARRRLRENLPGLLEAAHQRSAALLAGNGSP